LQNLLWILPQKDLTKKQVEQIFTGEITDWSAVGGCDGKISVYTRNTSSGTYAEFKELAMKKRDHAQDSQSLPVMNRLPRKSARTLMVSVTSAWLIPKPAGSK
jgi:phosphate transport system substrate-binding protein